MVVKPKKMSFKRLIVKIPLPHFNEMSRLVEIYNTNKRPDQCIDESYLASESLMETFQPEKTVGVLS